MVSAWADDPFVVRRSVTTENTARKMSIEVTVSVPDQELLVLLIELGVVTVISIYNTFKWEEIDTEKESLLVLVNYR